MTRSSSPIPNGPFVAQVFKITADPFVGRLTYFRVDRRHAQGAGPPLEREPHKADERIGNILGLLGKEQVNMPQAGPG